MNFSCIKPYLQIARFEHWFKNLLILPGVALAFRDWGTEVWTAATAWQILWAMGCACLVSSGNYVINEILDSPYDSCHPVKSSRPLAAGRAKPRWAWVLAFCFYIVGLVLAWFWIRHEFFLTLLLFIIVGGIGYNVPPLRWKEFAVLDVLTESVNNPIRFLLGWHALTEKSFPSWTLLISYWAFGAFLMSAKRLAELRHFEGGERAASYRKSFQYYTEGRLRTLMLGSVCLAFLLFFLVMLHYHAWEFLPVLPLGMVFAVWFFRLAHGKGVFPREVEKFWKEPAFAVYTVILALLVLGLSIYRLLPW